ncbi:MAG TPA: DUF3572 family protein [Devosia sp.]|nr:DUF3572 family protein [Devosia sp.]
MALKPNRLSIAELAGLCLDHLAQNPEQLAEFMVQSGIQPADLRGLVGTHEFAHGLIDYVVGNEPLLLAVASANQLKPESITQAWAMHHQHEH